MADFHRLATPFVRLGGSGWGGEAKQGDIFLFGGLQGFQLKILVEISVRYTESAQRMEATRPLDALLSRLCLLMVSGCFSRTFWLGLSLRHFYECGWPGATPGDSMWHTL